MCNGWRIQKAPAIARRDFFQNLFTLDILSDFYIPMQQGQTDSPPAARHPVKLLTVFQYTASLMQFQLCEKV